MDINNTMPLPTHPIFAAIGMTLALSGKFESFQETCNDFNIKSHIEISQQSNYYAIKTANDTEILFPKHLKGFSTSKSAIDKVYAFMICQIANQFFNENSYKIVFKLSALTEYKIAASIRSARQEVHTAINCLTQIAVKMHSPQKNGPVYKNTARLFSSAQIVNGKVIITLNNKFDWSSLLKQHINISIHAFPLSLPAFRIYQTVYNTIAKRKKTDDFSLSLSEVLTYAGIFYDKQNPSRWLNKINNVANEINDQDSLNISISPIIHGNNFTKETIRNSFIYAHRYKITKHQRKSNNCKGYIYRFYDENETLLYIGKTRHIQRRISSHLSAGHLPKECYQEVKYIEYAEVPTYTDAGILERYYIASMSPKYNIQYTHEGVPHCTIKPPDMKWIRIELPSSGTSSPITIKQPSISETKESNENTTRYRPAKAV